MLETQLKSNHTRAVIDTGCGYGWSSICDLGVAWALNVKHPRFLALCIGRTPVLSVKICVKKCVLYARKYGMCFLRTVHSQSMYLYTINGEATCLHAGT